jgi:hypothetical protein
MVEPYRLTASQALALMQKGELSVEDYAKSLLARIKERDHVVKAWAYLDPEFVLAQARALDQIPPEKRGPLHGISVGVKDVILTKGKLYLLSLYMQYVIEGFEQICRHATIRIYTGMGQRHLLMLPLLSRSEHLGPSLWARQRPPSSQLLSMEVLRQIPMIPHEHLVDHPLGQVLRSETIRLPLHSGHRLQVQPFVLAPLTAFTLSRFDRSIKFCRQR